MARGNHNRVALLSLAVFCVTAAIGIRLHNLQVVHAADFRERAQRQHNKKIVVEATRGAIVDRHGSELAISLNTEALYVHPRYVENPREIARKLAVVLPLSEAELYRRLTSKSKFEFLDRFCEPQAAAAVRAMDLPLGGNPLGFLPSSKRYYPHDHLGVHVIGFAGTDSKGMAGVELQFDEYLRGDPTEYVAVLDAHKGRLRKLVRPPKHVPVDVVLSIDLVLQYFVERELDRVIASPGALRASAVLIDPRTGQVLALADRPTIDANRFGDASLKTRRNHAVIDLYEPGSTFKIVTMAAALERRAVRPSHRFDCENGSFRFKSSTFHDTKRHGVLTAQQVLSRSSNIGMVKIANRIDDHALHAVIEDFGFGTPTGIELPGEAGGSLRPVSGWYNSTKPTISFGQGISATVLQVASSFATIANDGYRIPPRIVLGTRDSQGRLHRRAAPEAQRVVSESTVRELTTMMEEVILNGTGTRAQLPGYRLAGKSGTAQIAVPGGYSATDHIASFGGFGPVGSPRLAALVVIDTPAGREYHGGQVAAPVFQKIMVDALRHLRVPPEGGALRVAMAGQSAGAAEGSAR